jgi:DNA polymerase-4
VKIRYGDFETITRSCTLDAPSDATDDICRAARELFDRWASRSFRPVRLIGVAATRLAHGPVQLDLFPDVKHARRRRLDEVADRIVDRFGEGGIRRGDTMRRDDEHRDDTRGPGSPA